MAKTKEFILRKYAQGTFASFPTETELFAKKERRGFREGTKGLSGARMIDISRIKPDSDQPRRSYDKKTLGELAASIGKWGLLQPITVEYLEEEDCFKIINGERRYQAAKQAQLSQIPCIVKDIDRRLRLIHQLTENIQRQDLPPLEEAEAIQTHIRNRRLENPHYSQRKAARELGLPKSYVNEMLTLLKLPQDIKDSTSDPVPKSLLLLLMRQGDAEKIRALHREIKEKRLTVREAKTHLRKSKTKRGRPKYYQYIFQAPEKDFTLKLKFNKAKVDQFEIINALSRVLRSLRQEIA